MSEYTKDLEKLNELTRDKYFEVYKELGNQMFVECKVPTVADFAFMDEDEAAMEKIKSISSFTKNTDDIIKSAHRKSANYTEEESNKFMQSVIASNITDISESGYFYKKLISSCDNMRITKEDCKSKGTEFKLPITEDEYNYKVKFQYITELNSYTTTYKEFKKYTKHLGKIHVRNFLTCESDPNHRNFCKKCAGIYKRSYRDMFVPKDIGIYSTLMITEHATQSSLDSMNKGISEKINSILEQRLDKKGFPDYESVKKKIEEIIDYIGNIGVMSRYYEIALLSRFYKNSDGSFTPYSLQSSFLHQNDKLGIFIYRPTEKNFEKLLSSKYINANSTKSKIMMDIYDE